MPHVALKPEQGWTRKSRSLSGAAWHFRDEEPPPRVPITIAKVRPIVREHEQLAIELLQSCTRDELIELIKAAPFDARAIDAVSPRVHGWTRSALVAWLNEAEPGDVAAYAAAVVPQTPAAIMESRLDAARGTIESLRALIAARKAAEKKGASTVVDALTYH